MPGPRQILIAGVGNELLTDDGIGVHALRELEKNPMTGAITVAIGTDILRGLPFVESAKRVLLIDAARGGRPPGSIYLFTAGDTRPDGPLHSLHSMGLRDALRVLSPHCIPPAMTVIGVEPASFEYGMTLSPAVQAVLPAVVALARGTVEDWLRADRRAAELSACAEMITT
jgi:hydrogenase maturation protease